MAIQKKLYRSRRQRVLAGVLGGLGEYFSIDPSLLRLAYLVFAVATGIVPAILAYIVAALIIPQKPSRS